MGIDAGFDMVPVEKTYLMPNMAFYKTQCFDSPTSVERSSGQAKLAVVHRAHKGTLSK